MRSQLADGSTQVNRPAAGLVPARGLRPLDVEGYSAELAPVAARRSPNYASLSGNRGG